MSTAAPDRPMTLAEFEGLPIDESLDRELVRGHLVERPRTPRTKWQSRALVRIVSAINRWIAARSGDAGSVFGSDVGCVLPLEHTGVGIDVAYFSAETLAVQDEDDPHIVGAPVLAVEILSPSDTIERIQEKIRGYLEAGTAVVWEVDPRFENVTIYEPGEPSRMVSGDEDLSADPHLPGFVVPVRHLFERP